MIEPVKNFLFTKFWLPVIDESVYYNPYNTAVLAILFGLVILYVIKPLIDRMNIEIDRKFVLGFSPFIIFGGALRTLKDVDAINSVMLETPFVYLNLFLLGLSLLYTSKKIGEKYSISYHKVLATTGTLLTLVILPFFDLKTPIAILLFTGLTALWSIPGYLILRYKSKEFFTWEFITPVTAHYLDATSTFVALKFGADEKHVLGRIFIDIFGNGGMFILKTLIIIPVVAYIIRNFEGEEKIFYIFVITLLGLGIATRNIIQTVALG